MKKLLLLALLSVSVTMAFSQNVIRGLVTDPGGMAVIGATVLVDGTTTGTVTDIDGKFEIALPDGLTDLQVSYIGYESQVVTLGGEDYIEIRLTEGVALEEIVVTGYSSGSKRDATGAVSTIDAAELQAIPSSNVEQQLQGRAAGVTVITNGQPGTQSKVRIRGFGSFNANRPLYVVDGVPTQDISFLAPNDIETTTILKDAAVASIYGSRASSGVIVYTTKQGKRGDGVRIMYDGLIGATLPGEGQPILTPQEQADFTLLALQNERLNNGKDPDTLYSHPQYGQDVREFTVPDFLLVGDRTGVDASEVDLEAERELYSEDPNAPYIVNRANLAGTNWYDEITQTAILNRHNLGFSGGSEAGRFYFGLSAQDEKGTLTNSEFKRYGFRANSEFDLGNRVRVGENIQVTYSSTLGLIGGNGGQDVASGENDVLLAFRTAPVIPVRNEFGGYGGNRGSGLGNGTNAVANRENIANNQNRGLSTFGNVYAEVDILDGVFVRSLLGGTYGSYAGRSIGRAQYENGENNTNARYSEFNGYGYNWVWTNTVNFDRDLGGAHNLSGLVGYEALSIGNGFNANAFGLNPFTDNRNYVNLNQVQDVNAFSGLNTATTYASILGQLKYNFDDKYYVTGVVRQDQSSGFDADIRRGVFPAVSAAWRVTGEEFLSPGDVLSDLKIRAGYGVMGNADAVNSQNRFNLFGGNLGSNGYDLSGVNSGVNAGFNQTQIGNPVARWEQSTTINIGAEATLFGSNLDVVVDVWQRTNDDVLVTANLLAQYGSANRPFVNVGSIENQGIDLMLVYRDRIGSDFGFEATVTGSFLRNNVEQLAENIEFFNSGNTRLGSPVRNIVGSPMSSFFGYQVEGLWQSQAEIDDFNEGAPVDPEGNQQFQRDAAPGRFRFQDNNGRNEDGELTGVPDGQIDEADRTVLGDPIPNFTGGLNLRLEYKGFDLETFLYTSLGNEIFNFSKYFTDFYPVFPGAAISTRVKDSWTPENPSNTQPIFENNANFSSTDQINSFYVEDGSYLRMRNLTLGYNLPLDMFGGTISRARVTISGNNLFTITEYKGLDPQVGGAADTDFGIDVGNFPTQRSFNFGLGLTF